MSTPEASWFLLRSGPCAANWNMACDEALMRRVARLGRPVVRFYGWTEPAATFGYFQRYTDVSAMTALRPLLRRPTGGGLVPHDADWTYSVAVPPGEAWYQLKAVESYRRIHEWVADGFHRLGISVRLSECCRKEVAGQCFVGAEQFDVLHGDRKIAGAAQRRTRDGLLIQGSIQPPRLPQELSRADYEASFLASARERWSAGFEPLAAEELAALVTDTGGLVAEKYSRATYNEGR